MIESGFPSPAMWPLALYFAAIVALIAAILTTSWLVGERRKNRSPSVYESGMNPTGTTHIRLSVTYYLIAMFFLIFDLEAAFIFAWAVSLRKAGWTGYIGMVIFIVVMAAGFIYLWKEGALDLKPIPIKRETDEAPSA